jgi:hypothetical protein
VRWRVGRRRCASEKKMRRADVSSLLPG